MAAKSHPIQSLIMIFLVTFSHGAFILPKNTRNESAFHSCRLRDARSRRTTQSSTTFTSFQLQRTLRRKATSSCLHARPQDNLVAGISEIGFGFLLGVLWSEYSIVSTGCGPLNFSDTLERLCYQGMIALAGIALFNRIVSNGKGLDASAVDFFGPLEEFTLVQLRAAEYASGLAVLGAFVALAFQYIRGGNMDGLSGIDINLCRALRDL